MTYEEVLTKIDSSRFFRAKPGLEHITALLSLLGNPQESLKAVHVAGTNGKGTTCTLIASVLRKAGYRVGLYLSPHVCDFRERMQFCGEMIPRCELAAAAERVFPAAERLRERGMAVGEFELITAIAMLWFAERRCEIVVLEVGLGGRFDATNIIRRPLVSVLTSLSLDHTKILGDTLEKIAREKCGIIKRGCPVVCSPGEPEEALTVIRRIARERSARLTEAPAGRLRVGKSDLYGTEMEVSGVRLKLPFAGAHQVKNAAAALAALDVLRGSGWNISASAVRDGFAAARLPARLEVLSRDPVVLLDGAHNPAGTAALADALRRCLPGKKIVAVMGMMADKDTARAVENLAGCFRLVVAAAPPSPRAMSAEDFAELWRRQGTPARAGGTPEEALARAFSALKPEEALVVCGSLYLAGELRAAAVRTAAARKK
jgi:dihydrofolate synthase/folylpolyglutamate synthase